MTAIDVQTESTRPAMQEAFARRGYVVLPGLIVPPLADFFWSYAHTKFASQLLVLGDRSVPNTPASYGDHAFEGLLEFVRPRVEAACGLRLLPTYAYFRIYKHGDVLKRHRDRPACEITVSLNIGQTPSEPWLLYVERDKEADVARLMPGDALIYRGIECFHWREPYPGTQLVQVFLHYVNRDGPHAGRKYDGRATLMRPKEPGGTGQPDAQDAVS
jgi:hypothetical protein